MLRLCGIRRARFKLLACVISIFIVLYYASTLVCTLQIIYNFAVQKDTLSVAKWRSWSSATERVQNISYNFAVQDDSRLESYLQHFNGFKEFANFDNVTGADGFVVPNIVHYIRFNKTSFSFVDYCCVRSALINQRPDFIFLHTNVQAFDGPFWRRMLNEASLRRRIRVFQVDVPYSIFDQKLDEKWRLYHGSDIVRVQNIQKYGGI